MSLWRRLLLRLFSVLWIRGPKGGSVGACANRRWHRFMSGPVEVTIAYRDTRLPDGYERTELLQMLHDVRKHEASQGWKVPEPESK